ncbi:hypothetical protein M0220_06290 [Halomonas qinghailakensis]|uniref:Uncharacterized protein n=1 Tax=Halomonas qinghailakensis TaxID=2937790 RepID=A0AA46TSH7_9GAMM|nr:MULTISPECIES: hypothetical protein [Halomonas]UYO75753.1 hypothetical protein M0220_06290 [Halomonas sp. ZZQ-149]
MKKIHDNYHDPQLKDFALPVAEQALAETISEFKTVSQLTPRAVGNVLKFRADRVANGKRLRRRNGRGGIAAWVIENV